MAKTANFDTDHIIKSKGKLSKKKDSLYKSSFSDLDDKTVYWDPLGFRKGESVDLKKEFWKEYKERGIVEDFDQMQEKGWPLEETVKEIAKNYDTGDWNIPIFFVPEIRVSNPEQTPVADNIPRVSVNSDTVNVTEETDQPDPSFGLETTDDTEGSYDYADGTYVDHQYDVVGYGVASRLEDKMVLSSDVLRATSSVAEQAHATGIRQTEERQILRGTENDATGFNGMKDEGTNLKTIDLGTTTPNWKEELRELISEVEYQGGDRGNIAVIVDFDTFNDIANDLEDEVRYVDPGDELGYGFQALKFDGVQIWKSHGLVRQDTIATDATETGLIAADMGSNYMAMLQDMTVKPLAKVAPQEQFATDVYGTFVSEAPSHIQYIDITGA